MTATLPLTSEILDVFVPGKPISQGSKTLVAYRGPNGRMRVTMRESAKHLASWRELIAYTARQAYGARPLIPRDVPVTLDLEFVLPRPASAPKRRTPPAVKKPDLDKIARAVGDALTHVVYSDDSQVTELHARKRVAEPNEPPGVHIRVTTT